LVSHNPLVGHLLSYLQHARSKAQETIARLTQVRFTSSSHCEARFLHHFYARLATLSLTFCLWEATMMDLIYLAVLVGFLLVSAVLVHGCERLMRRRS
jgi:hypothetical protein